MLDAGLISVSLAKFTKCVFRRCSFSTVRFESVQFLECSWREMGLSSGEMHFDEVLITNPEEFVASAYTNLDRETLAQSGTTPEYQKYRLEGTKAKIARTLLTNLQGLSDDLAYYVGVKTYVRQAVAARLSEAMYEAGLASPLWKKAWQLLLASALRLELAILSISGLVNGWGRSIGRPLVVGGVLVLLFWSLYEVAGAHTKPNTSNLLAAVEITLLFGYTKYASTDVGTTAQLLECLNGVLGLWWYAILVPTVVNRISRVHA